MHLISVVCDNVIGSNLQFFSLVFSGPKNRVYASNTKIQFEKKKIVVLEGNLRDDNSRNKKSEMQQQ